MKILELKLYTNQLEKAKEFYQNIFECKIISDSKEQFSIEIGWTKLTFNKSDEVHHYHYAFLVSKDQFNKAFDWSKNHFTLLNTEENNQIAFFENWNAESFYFYDGAENLAEIITHHNLDSNDTKEFSPNKLLGVSEIGLPTLDIQAINQMIEEQTNSKFWKGDFERFGTNGTDEGKILLPNYSIKTTWFPTDLKITSQPFEAIIEVNNKLFQLNFKENKLNIFNLPIS